MSRLSNGLTPAPTPAPAPASTSLLLPPSAWFRLALPCRPPRRGPTSQGRRPASGPPGVVPAPRDRAALGPGTVGRSSAPPGIRKGSGSRRRSRESPARSSATAPSPTPPRASSSGSIPATLGTSTGPRGSATAMTPRSSRSASRSSTWRWPSGRSTGRSPTLPRAWPDRPPGPRCSPTAGSWNCSCPPRQSTASTPRRIDGSGSRTGLTDPHRGDQFLGVGRDFPVAEDPSLWATLELIDEPA